MDDRLVHVQQLRLVDRAVLPHEVTRRCARDRVFHERRAHQVNLRLRVFAQVDVPVTRRRALHREQRVQHERIFPVVVKPRLRHRPPRRDLQRHRLAVRPRLHHRVRRRVRLVLRRVEHHVSHVLAVMQDLPHVVVDLDDRHLPVRRDVVVVQELLRREDVALELPLALWICLLHEIPVGQLRLEYVPRLLDVALARLPE